MLYLNISVQDALYDVLFNVHHLENAQHNPDLFRHCNI